LVRNVDIGIFFWAMLAPALLVRNVDVGIFF